jgi:hypothetical protein
MKKYYSLTAIAAVAVLLSACATSIKGGPGSTHYAEDAIRDAKAVGAETYAMAEYTTANASLAKAKQLFLHNRPDRAQKLLQLSIAQADLAKAISEAEHAEATLSQLQDN